MASIEKKMRKENELRREKKRITQEGRVEKGKEGKKKGKNLWWPRCWKEKKLFEWEATIKERKKERKKETKKERKILPEN